jgi:hypothetical protein
MNAAATARQRHFLVGTNKLLIFFPIVPRDEPIATTLPFIACPCRFSLWF